MWRISAFDRDGSQILHLDVERGEVSIGRDVDRRIVLPSPAVSRRHARLVLDPPQPYIIDDGSANGVHVNGVRIAGPTAVAPGVRIDIADFRIELEQPAPGERGDGTQRVRTLDEPIAGPHGGARPGFQLVGQGGPAGNQTFDLPSIEAFIGRALDNQIVLDDPSLSRKHARLRLLDAVRVEIEDLGSSNGTYINNRKVGRGTATAGDMLRFGDLVFQLVGPAAAAAGELREGTRRWPRYAVGAAVTVGAFAVIFGLVIVIKMFSPSRGGPGVSATARGDELARHLHEGKAQLAGRKFELAAAAFERALSLAPEHEEAKRLKALAEAEPKNEQLANLIVRRADESSRSALEQAVRFLGKLNKDSTFRAETTRKVVDKLVQFGKGKCTAHQYPDCAWALCTSYEIAPVNDRPGNEVAVTLKEAERKLGKAWRGCKAAVP